jgi:4-amino-4-deoxy-L-arabinose transferase-like glycosyltransferase
MFWAAGGEHLWIPRLVAALVWVSGAVPLYFLVRRPMSQRAALAAAAFYLFAPLGIVASGSFQPDSWAVTAQLWALLAVVVYQQEPSKRHLLLAATAAGLATVLKLQAAFMVLPVFTATSIGRLGWRRGLPAWRTALFVVIAVLPASVWYLSRPGPSSVYFLPSYFLTSDFWVGWAQQITIAVGLLTALAVALAALFLARGLTRSLMIGWALGYLALAFAFNYRIATHDYYSLPLIPLVSAGLGLIVDSRGRLRRALLTVALTNIVFLLFLGLPASGALSIGSISSDASAIDAYQASGNQVGHGSKVTALSPAYGLPFEYYGDVVVLDWPHQADLELDARAGHPDPPAGAALEQLVRTQRVRWFVVLDAVELNRQLELKQLLDSRYHVVRSDGYLCMT